MHKLLRSLLITIPVLGTALLALTFGISLSAIEAPPSPSLKARILQLELQVAQLDAQRAACTAQLVGSRAAETKAAIEKEAGCPSAFDWQTLACQPTDR
jgi:hypothetical protein